MFVFELKDIWQYLTISDVFDDENVHAWNQKIVAQKISTNTAIYHLVGTEL